MGAREDRPGPPARFPDSRSYDARLPPPDQGQWPILPPRTSSHDRQNAHSHNPRPGPSYRERILAGGAAYNPENFDPTPRTSREIGSIRIQSSVLFQPDAIGSSLQYRCLTKPLARGRVRVAVFLQ